MSDTTTTDWRYDPYEACSFWTDTKSLEGKAEVAAYLNALETQNRDLLAALKGYMHEYGETPDARAAVAAAEAQS